MVRYALLGLLREQADYGYRLKRRFDERVGSLWQLNIGQVYQTLGSMKRAGLVAVTEEEHESDPQSARRLFALTAKGLRVLEGWLQKPPTRPRPVRDETLIRLLLLQPGRADEAIHRIAAQEHLYRKHHARLLAQKRHLPSKLNAESAGERLALEATLLHAEAHLKWLEYCRLAVLDAPHAYAGSPDPCAGDAPTRSERTDDLAKRMAR